MRLSPYTSILHTTALPNVGIALSIQGDKLHRGKYSQDFMNRLLFYVWLMFSFMFQSDEPVTPIYYCLPGQALNTAGCSYTGHDIPGFPTRDTWTRNENTPTVFYGRAIHYAPGIMWSTAIARGFEIEYLQKFDCLISGFFINDVGRVAWILHKGTSYQCLIVDNARPRDLYETVIHTREAIEIEHRFARDVLGNTLPHEGNPVVIVAYQQEEPSLYEWANAARLDEYLFENWVTSYHGEPKGWIQIKADHQTWYMIDEEYRYFKPIPGCLYCKDNMEFAFTKEITDYTVISGDSLSAIAKKVYGYSHPRFWEAIYNANLDIMDSPAKLMPGMILKIPTWELIEVLGMEVEDGRHSTTENPNGDFRH
jgi:phage tail protein X